MGFRLVIFPGGTVRALVRSLQDYFISLREHGSTAAFRDRMHDFAGLNEILGTGQILADARKYDLAAEQM
ncbi:MAG: hypothetical protein JO326_05005 [Acetobacteraceae bacterium]|nr:hypothetical protein [Acetobacteraceae bacterium]